MRQFCGKNREKCFGLKNSFLYFYLKTTTWGIIVGFKIGTWEFPKGICAAPLEGITDDPSFRLMCRMNGAELTYVPMISISDYTKHPNKTRILFPHDKSEKPFAVQLLGNAQSDVKTFFENLELEDLGIIDLNLCCAARSALVNNTGGALLRKPGKAAVFAENVIKYSPVPVTAKMRSGWSREENYGVQIAQELEKVGIAAITVHGVSVKAKYAVKSNPKYIRQIHEVVNVPVIANGDIRSIEDRKQVLDATGAAGVMIGRASIGNPFIFLQLDGKSAFQFTSLPGEIKPLWLMLDYLQLSQEHCTGMEFSRAKHFLYVHLKDASKKQILREQLGQIKTLGEFFASLIPIYPLLKQHPLVKEMEERNKHH